MDLTTVQSLEAQYLFPTYARVPLLLERGKGPYVFASDGKRYLDFITGIGVNALGHAHPRILKVIRDQSKKIIHTSNVYYNEFQGVLAQRLTALAGMERAFFTVSGAEAAEGAIKVARSLAQKISPEKIELVALHNAFHGRTMGALSVTGQTKYRAPFGPLLPGVRFVPANDQAALAAAVNANTCAIILEPVQGEGGIFELTPDYLATAARIAREAQATLIIDEIQCGLGRTGKPFAFQWTDLVPDIVITAKPIASGYPLGVIMARGTAATALTSGTHGTTFGGGPLACRIALEVLDILESPGMYERILETGALLKAGMTKLARRHKFVKEVRGKGLMLGMELDRPAAPVFNRMVELGLLANVTHDTIIRMLPPYIIEPKHAKKALGILGKALTAI
ncbi:MAG TPA: acetylornithine/succinylornithine family transaminase [Terriglobales bacterium]|jgi:predicted acetylornithine/succinylornithine family transaminase